MSGRANSLYDSAAARAVEAVEHDVSLTYVDCRNPGNTLVFLFLRELVEQSRQIGSQNWEKSLTKAMHSVKDMPLRLWESGQLMQLPHIAEKTTQAITRHLWTLVPPDPPSAEELALADCHRAALAKEQCVKKARDKEAAQRRKAEAASGGAGLALQGAGLGTGGMSGADTFLAPTIIYRGPGLSDAAKNANAAALEAEMTVEAGGQDGANGQSWGSPKKKRAATAPREYQPKPGTANYAFLIVLLQAHRSGEHFLTKHQIMERAEQLRITKVPIVGNSVQAIVQGNFTKVYDGWSNFKRLSNNEPPLAQEYSNPKKVKLTPEGERLAERVFLDAVARGSIPDDPACRPTPGAGPPAPTPGPPAGRHTDPYTSAAPGRDAFDIGLPPPPAKRARPAVHGKSGVAGLAWAARPPTLGLLSNRSRPATGPEADPKPRRLPTGAWRGSGASGAAPRSVPAAQRPEAMVLDGPGSEPGKPPGWNALALATGSPSGAEEGSNSGLRPALGAGAEAAGTLGSRRPQENGHAAPERHGGAAGVAEVVRLDLSDSEDDKAMDDPGPALPPLASQQDDSGAPHAELLRPDVGTDDLLAASQTGPGPGPGQFALRPAQHAGTTSSDRRPGPAPYAHSRFAPHAVPSAVAGTGAMAQGAGRPGRSGVAGAPGPPRPGSLGALSRAASGLSATASQASSESGQDHTWQERSCGAWRLAGVGGAWGLEDRDIRLPPLPPGARFADVYEVVLVIDQREQFGRCVGSGGSEGRNVALAAALRRLDSQGVTVLKATLMGGDALWVARERGGRSCVWALDWVAERKSVKDLAQSIKAVRYEGQKYFLRRCGLRRLMYLIEGSLEAQDGWEAKATKTARFNTEIVDGFRVLHTADTSDTFRLYATITHALAAKLGGLRADSTCVDRDSSPLPTLEELTARVQAAKQVTVRDAWGLMLTALPGIGAELADAVLRQHPTPFSLYSACAAAMARAAASGERPAAAAAAVLTGLPVSAARRVSAREAGNIFGALFANGWVQAV